VKSYAETWIQNGYWEANLRLKEYLRSTGTKAVDLAAAASVTPSDITRYATYGWPAPRDKAARISAATNGSVSIEELIFPDGIPDGAKFCAGQC